MDIITFFTTMAPDGELARILDLAVAFILSSCIGFERETKLKSAGLRTHALVGLSAALLMLVSKHGFTDVLMNEHVGLDPSRIAAQIVSGIGFIGGGLIFVRKDIVHGLTTAATVWLTAAIGMACGAGMHELALVTCGGYFIVVFGYTAFMSRLRGDIHRLRVRYRIGHDAAGAVLALCADNDFIIMDFAMDSPGPDPETAFLEIRLRGKASVEMLVRDLATLPTVVSVTANPAEG